MAYDARSVANAILEMAAADGKRLTNMQMQKLVYISHGYTLAMQKEPLLYQGVYAWQYGPVIPDLYEALKQYGAGYVEEPIPELFEGVNPNSPEMDIIRSVWKAYGKFSGPKLSEITHRGQTPWSVVWKERPYGLIHNELIAQHYEQLLHERTQARDSAA
jgi:uncharacterized phage-associated protein